MLNPVCYLWHSNALNQFVFHVAAMLTVEDPAFWQGVEPVKFGVLPRLQDSVTVIGYSSV